MSIPLPDSVTVTNLFTNPEGERTSGEVVVWEDLWIDPLLEQTDTGAESAWDSLQRCLLTSDGGQLTITRTTEEGASRAQCYFNADGIIDVGEHITFRIERVVGSSISNGSNPGTMALQWYNESLSSEISPQVSTEIDLSGSGHVYTLTVERPNVDAKRLAIRLSTGGANGDAVTWTRPQLVIGDTVYTDFFAPGIDFPDPDLTPQPRPGGGSQLVGQSVSGYFKFRGGCVIRSTIGPNKTTARLINNGYSHVSWNAQIQSMRNANRAIVRIQQEAYQVPTSLTWWGYLFFDGGGGTDKSRVRNNGDEVQIQTLTRSASGGDYLGIAGYYSNIGDSLWIDLPTLVEDADYDGPQFSGDTEPFMYKGQMVFPKWDGEPHNSTSSFVYYESPGPSSPTIAWDKAIQRAYHLGVSRGVLELDGVVYPWSGLTSAEISPDSEAPIRRFIDGIVYDVRIPPTNHQGKVSAFTYPLEFEEFIGNPNVDDSGLRAHGQQYKPFNMAFRTEVGSARGVEHYKLHFVYGAYAIPSTLNYDTINSSPEGSAFDFDILTTAQRVSGFRPTAYFTVDTREENRVLVQAIENALYGFEGSDPWFPTIDQLRAALGR